MVYGVSCPTASFPNSEANLGQTMWSVYEPSTYAGRGLEGRPLASWLNYS